MIYNVSATNTLLFTQVTSVVTGKGVEAYGSVRGGDSYFYNRIGASDWEEASQRDREKALATATRAIDVLSYAGDKTVSTQKRQFPRNGDTTVPLEIEFACYEIALQLLKEVDPEVEAYNISVTSQGFAKAKTDYDRSFIADNIRAGIPSHQAWLYLKTYLIDPRRITLRRSD